VLSLLAVAQAEADLTTMFISRRLDEYQKACSASWRIVTTQYNPDQGTRIIQLRLKRLKQLVSD
jgi:hypothetical protein